MEARLKGAIVGLISLTESVHIAVTVYSEMIHYPQNANNESLHIQHSLLQRQHGWVRIVSYYFIYFLVFFCLRLILFVNSIQFAAAEALGKENGVFQTINILCYGFIMKLSS